MLLPNFNDSIRKTWQAFRRLPIFVQLLIVVPVICGMIPYLLIGNMGLALMGTAISINTFFVGWVGAVSALFWGKKRVKTLKSSGEL